MLISLEIADFAIIDQLAVEFGAGLNALTGETGAGKSILIDALGLALGDRSAAGSVRTGAKVARIDATFDLRSADQATAELLDRLEIEPEDGFLVLTRELHDSGRTVARVNGRLSTAAILAEVGSQLVDIHGQSDHLSLLRPAEQLAMIDAYAELASARSELASTVVHLRELERRRNAWLTSERNRAQRIDILQLQTAEIDASRTTPGEDERLEREAIRLRNLSRLQELVGRADVMMEGEDEGALPLLRQMQRDLIAAGQLDEDLEPAGGRLDELVILATDLQAELRDYLSQLDADPNRLDAVEERIQQIRRLKQKYGETVEKVLEFGASASEELAALTGNEGSAEALQEEIDTLRARAAELARHLHSSRSEASAELVREVESAMADLNLGGAHLLVDIHQQSDPRGLPNADGELVSFDESGTDQVEFLWAPHRGDAPRPLARIASGGETARLMLAIRSVLAGNDRTPTLVFDEIDVGIGGRSGQPVGRMMKRLSNGHQVLVISHLPQIAVFADQHLKIAKEDRSGRTTSSVQLLTGDFQIDEIAEMIDGAPPSPASRAKACEMLELAKT